MHFFGHFGHFFDYLRPKSKIKAGGRKKIARLSSPVRYECNEIKFLKIGLHSGELCNFEVAKTHQCPPKMLLQLLKENTVATYQNGLKFRAELENNNDFDFDPKPKIFSHPNENFMLKFRNF